ncbi:uncharacterized protein LOC108468247 [Gossypium arboreum]|uniref:uncharacterized protein LOC108468247 n=1 Tax=Gossypium arboreum TaxID=29729 RepID=UPI000818FF12|nr:uncharacterized protein LOC108468247 [Gossypium arboreum]
MKEVARTYFQNLFSAGRRGNYNHILSGIDQCIFDEDSSKLKERYTKEEIWEALKEMGPTKVPEDDGFSALFYQKCWSIIGEDTTSFRLNFLNEAYELLHTLKQKRVGKKGLMAVKLDMSKIYDRVEWKFVEGVMKKMGFDSDWVDSLMKCVTTVSYSVVFNGFTGQYFTPSRDLRQGDPLSPFLFLFCGEGLSSLISSNTQEGEKRVVTRVLGVRSSNNPERYLGLPNLVGRKKKESFQSLKDRLLQRIDNWSIKHLSQGGNEKNRGKKGIHWCAWKDMCALKDEGGNSPLLTWKSVWATKGLLEKGLCWRVGKGDRISIWSDIWIPNVEENRLQNQISNVNIEFVSDLIDEKSRSWKTKLLVNTFHTEIVKKIMQILLPRAVHDYFQVWGGEPSGNFSVRSAYKLLQRATLVPSNNNLQAEIKTFYRKLWNLHVPSKLKIIVWKISWNYIPTLANLKIKRVAVETQCPRKFGNGLLGFSTGEQANSVVFFAVDYGSSGQVLHSDVASPFTTEAFAGLDAIRLGSSMGFNACMILGDSKTVIKKCQSADYDRSVIGALIRDIQLLKIHFQDLGFLFIPKSENLFAHFTARKTLKENENHYLEAGVSSWVQIEVERLKSRAPD